MNVSTPCDAKGQGLMYRRAAQVSYVDQKRPSYRWNVGHNQSC